MSGAELSVKYPEAPQEQSTSTDRSGLVQLPKIAARGTPINLQQDPRILCRTRRQLRKGSDEPHESGITLAGLFGNSIERSSGNNKDIITIERGYEFIV